MPNWYTNICLAWPADEFDPEEFLLKHADSNFCSIVRPIPERLEEIHLGHHGTLKVDRWTEDSAGVATAVDERELIAQFGHADWRSWSHEHWGCKWGTSELSAVILPGDMRIVVISFQTPWNAPNVGCLEDIASWLKRTQHFQRTAWIGGDPYDDSIRQTI